MEFLEDPCSFGASGESSGPLQPSSAIKPPGMPHPSPSESPCNARSLSACDAAITYPLERWASHAAVISGMNNDHNYKTPQD
ncbi:hypothetical protein IG631_08932 [Alternaria alternata]|nr:hypothetical protein IG631_08932 [Alternaria alternata]